MRITIDNLDGLGALDYSGWIAQGRGLKLKRRLNAPSVCECSLDLSACTLRRPVRRGRVVVSLDEGAVLFTGYVATDPSLSYVGLGTEGNQYHVGLSAISDEWLLDRQGATTGGAGFQQSGAAALSVLTSRTGLTAFTTSGGWDRPAGGRICARADAPLVG